MSTNKDRDYCFKGYGRNYVNEGIDDLGEDDSEVEATLDPNIPHENDVVEPKEAPRLTGEMALLLLEVDVRLGDLGETPHTRRRQAQLEKYLLDPRMGQLEYHEWMGKDVLKVVTNYFETLITFVRPDNQDPYHLISEKTRNGSTDFSGATKFKFLRGFSDGRRGVRQGRHK